MTGSAPIRGIGVVAACLLALTLLSAPVFAETPQSARYGVYGTKWASWVEQTSHPQSLYIYQMPIKPDATDAQTLARIEARGVDVIVVQKIHASRAERWLRKGAKPDRPSAQVADDISSTFNSPYLAGVSTISLDEENVWWRGRENYLGALYRDVKARMPRLQVWQFFAEGSRRQRRRDRPKRFTIPADGYIFDEYSMEGPRYRTLVEEYAAQGKPVVSILWASANWQTGNRQKRARDNDWWNRTGWRQFYEKSMVNRLYNIPTVYFMYDIPLGDPGGRLVPSFRSDDACARAFVEKFFRETLPTFHRQPVSLTAPTVRPDWVAERCPR